MPMQRSLSLGVPPESILGNRRVVDLKARNHQTGTKTKQCRRLNIEMRQRHKNKTKNDETRTKKAQMTIIPIPPSSPIHGRAQRYRKAETQQP